MSLIKRTAGVVLTLALSIVPLLAQQPPRQQNEFVPMDQLPPAEQLPSAPLLVGAYAFVWIATMFYLWTVWRRLGKVERDIEALERKSRSGAR